VSSVPASSSERQDRLPARAQVRKRYCPKSHGPHRPPALRLRREHNPGAFVVLPMLSTGTQPPLTSSSFGTNNTPGRILWDRSPERIGAPAQAASTCPEFRVESSEFRVQGFTVEVRGSRFMVEVRGSRFEVHGPGLRFRVRRRRDGDTDRADLTWKAYRGLWPWRGSVSVDSSHRAMVGPPSRPQGFRTRW